MSTVDFQEWQHSRFLQRAIEFSVYILIMKSTLEGHINCILNKTEVEIASVVVQIKPLHPLCHNK